jgi:hypothetical protein
MEQATARLQNIGSQITNSNVGQGATDAVKTISQTVSNATENVSSGLKSFSSQSVVNASQSFLDSNSIIAKFVFLIFVLIVFLIVLNLGIMLIAYLLSPPKSPYVIQGLINGNMQLTVNQDPQNTSSATIFRSNNRSNGIEASWAFWINISSFTHGTNTYSHVFNKGNNVYTGTDKSTPARSGLATINNGPGVYLISDKTNPQLVDLVVFMDETNVNASQQEKPTVITNMPINKWVHVVIRIQGQIMDTYINGTIANRQIFATVPKQNYDPVYIGWNKGFSGQLSNIIYYDHALGVFDINNLVLAGPNLVQSSSVKSNIGNYTYMSNLWYANKIATTA